MKTYLVIFGAHLILGTINSLAQEVDYAKDEMYRGTITPQRQWWDLKYYHLDLTVNPEKKYISGTNTIRYEVLESKKVLQIDLQPPLKIHKVTNGKKVLSFKKMGTNAYFVNLRKKQKVGDVNEITVHYAGHPRKARDAPWDGGFSWKKDSNGKHFVATSCQIIGASVWWPCKDHMYDEVDSMRISVTFPKDYMNVSNGRLEGVEKNDSLKTTHWFVSNPINSYGVNLNIGDYVNFRETYEGEKGKLDLSYWVLRDNLETAKEHFKQVPKALEAFEYWFGPYPFYEDGFKIVEVPYPGMEHQSSITYGNGYFNGYYARDFSHSGWGCKFDYILIHETGHEWFANNITYKDVADLWIHEAFTAYSESLYLEYHFGKQAASEYVIGTRHSKIMNDAPIIGHYGLNKKGSYDAYDKGANMVHTLRQWIDDDAQFRTILRGLNSNFWHQTVTSQQIETYLAKKTRKDLSAFFDQYLRTIKVPILEYTYNGEELKFRYVDTVTDFDMPLRIFVDGEPQWICPKKNTEWKTIELKGKEMRFDKNFYVIYRATAKAETSNAKK